MCSDGRSLYLSNGSSRISIRDPETFAETGGFQVRGPEGEIAFLNELEWVNGELWANVWQTKWIVRIDPETGSVLGRIDLEQLPFPEHRHSG